MAAKLKIEATIADLTGADLVARLRPANSPRTMVNILIGLFGALSGGTKRGRLRVSVDSTLGVAAAQTITCVQASSTAGDKLTFITPSGKIYRFTAVSGTPVPASGEYAIISSNTAVANSIRAAMAAVPGFLVEFVASGTTTLVVTARKLGSEYNLTRTIKNVTTAGAFTGTGLFTGGIDPGAQSAVTFTLTDVGTANDTLTIGGQVLTLVASAANEDQVTIGASAGATASAIAAAINVHTKLKGLVAASASGASTGIVTMTLMVGSGRLGLLVALLKSCSVGTLSATSFATSTTDAWASSVVEYGLGSV